jgi:hypothetical protein
VLKLLSGEFKAAQKGGRAVIARNDCSDNVRYSLTDSGGKLRFVEFEIVGALRNTPLARTLTEYFKGRCLEDVFLEDIPKDCCVGDYGCAESILKEITRLQQRLSA